MIQKHRAFKDLQKLHIQLKGQIKDRLREFEEIWASGSEEDIFHELVFCLLTPQSKAKSCFDAVSCLIDDDILLTGNAQKIAKTLKGKVRFHNNKAKHVVLVRQMFTNKGNIQVRHAISDCENPYEAREWFVKNIKGMGYKEASHFLRNIGFGENLAILDRHILKNLAKLGVIREVPVSISRKRYLEIEAEMKEFAENIKIPMSHLDLLLWYMETKEIFK
jgi:N-glycosylase/DNA lyase